MLVVSNLALRLLSALAIGLLLGAERERRKGEGPSRSASGIRTFAIASLIGAVTVVIGNEWAAGGRRYSCCGAGRRRVLPLAAAGSRIDD